MLLFVTLILCYDNNVESDTAKGERLTNIKFIPLFKNAEELKSRTERYFLGCEGVQALDGEGLPLYDKSGAPVMSVPETPLTVSGLALALGFPSRKALLEYKGKASYMDIIVRALSHIEEYAEGKLFDKGQYSGAKFFLANNFYGWNDKPDESGEETMQKLDAVLHKLTESMKS